MFRKIKNNMESHDPKDILNWRFSLLSIGVASLLFGVASAVLPSLIPVWDMDWEEMKANGYSFWSVMVWMLVPFAAMGVLPFLSLFACNNQNSKPFAALASYDACRLS